MLYVCEQWSLAFLLNQCTFEMRVKSSRTQTTEKINKCSETSSGVRFYSWMFSEEECVEKRAMKKTGDTQRGKERRIDGWTDGWMVGCIKNKYEIH